MRRFMQTFVLNPQSPKKYYVHNDIFRYQDEVYIDEQEMRDDEHEQAVESEEDRRDSGEVVPEVAGKTFYAGEKDEGKHLLSNGNGNSSDTHEHHDDHHHAKLEPEPAAETNVADQRGEEEEVAEVEEEQHTEEEEFKDAQETEPVVAGTYCNAGTIAFSNTTTAFISPLYLC